MGSRCNLVALACEETTLSLEALFQLFLFFL